MENYELTLSDEELSSIIGKIIATKADDEPDFSSKEGFFTKGFHPRAFSWLPQDFEFVLLNKGLIDGNDKDIVEFQKGLASDIEESGYNQVSYLKEHYVSLAKKTDWCDYRFLRKAILCRLFKHSFPLLEPQGNRIGDDIEGLKYPAWLPGKWLQNIIPSSISCF